jgi:hypothetical protein
MDTNAKTSAPRDPLRQLLKYAGAAPAFKKLTDDGVNSEWLTREILWLQEYRPLKETGSGKLFARREKFRKLATKLAALAGAIDNLSSECWWPLVRLKADKQLFHVDVLCEQLRAGSEYFSWLGSVTEPLFDIHITDSWLVRLANEIEKRTGKEHYKEISVLLEAATSGCYMIDEFALKQRVHRARKK